MATGSWSPEGQQASSQNFELKQTQLNLCLALSNEHSLATLATQLSELQIQQLAPIMQLTANDWEQACSDLSDAELENLMRFFTKAEALPGWEAGDQSPVIWLGKILKKRGTGINKDLVLWIKANSDNRFLPHGSLL